jgi:imidazolonepropionase-like amidohydrolase
VDLEQQRRRYADRCDNFQGLLAAGVRLVAGSDAGWGYYPFGGFVDEVEAMAAAGMGAANALQAATSDSARSMGVDSDVGTIQPGKFADMLLADGDATEDVEVLGRVAAVFFGGTRLR